MVTPDDNHAARVVSPRQVQPLAKASLLFCLLAVVLLFISRPSQRIGGLLQASGLVLVLAGLISGVLGLVVRSRRGIRAALRPLIIGIAHV